MGVACTCCPLYSMPSAPFFLSLHVHCVFDPSWFFFQVVVLRVGLSDVATRLVCCGHPGRVFSCVGRALM